MRTTLSNVTAVLLLSSVAYAQEPAVPLDVPAAIKAITAYENLFATSRIAWSWSASGLGKGNVELALNQGKKYRKDIKQIKDEPAQIQVTVLNDESCKIWIGWDTDSDIDKSGQGTIVAAESERGASQFQEYLFRTHAIDQIFEYPTIEITRQTETTVTMRYLREGMYVDAEYLRDGDYLKVVRYQYHPNGKGKVRDGTVFRYEYPASGDDKLRPTKVEQISTIHGVHDVFVISSVDFKPVFAPDQFTLEFPEGASVQDLRAVNQD